MRRFPIAAVAVMALLHTPAVSAAEPLRLAPTSQWRLDYGNDKCTLQRQFGSGADAMELQIDQSGPGPFYNILLFGAPAGRNAGDTMRIAFGPDEGVSERSFLSSVRKDGVRPFIMMHGIHLAPATRPDPDSPPVVAEIGPEREKAITTLTLSKGLRVPVVLEIGEMRAPLDAMRICVADLVQSLKLDETGLAQIAKGPQPKNIQKLAQFIQQRYPQRAAQNGDDGTVAVQLTINDKGRVTTCQIAASDRPAVFDDAACFGFLRMAEFEPAIGVDGRPRYSFWRTRVTYRTN
jgi:TonB family protein